MCLKGLGAIWYRGGAFGAERSPLTCYKACMPKKTPKAPAPKAPAAAKPAPAPAPGAHRPGKPTNPFMVQKPPRLDGRRK